MAMYTDFFLASEEALRRAFPGWGDASVGTGGDPASPDLTGLAMAQMKSVDPLKLAQLLVAARGEPLSSALGDCTQTPLIAPESVGGALQLVRVSERCTEIFGASAEERERLATKWEAVLVADFESIRNASAREFEISRWTGACVRILATLAELVEKRRPGESLYLLVTV
jgi:hypothetical protein